MGWFSNNKKAEREIARLRQEIAELKRNRTNKSEPKHVTNHYHFHIEHIDIHNPRLDDLSFQLDSLDIEDLSGSLNLGNNFTSEKTAKPIHSQDKDKRVRKTKQGYSVSFSEKED